MTNVKNKKMKTIITTLMLLIASYASAQTGREIMQKVKDRPNGITRQSEMSMTLTNKRGRQRIRKVTSFSIDIGKDKKTIMFFTYPGDVKGTGFLTWDYDKIGKEDDKWLYLPSLKKNRRISGNSAKKDYFMGTDFTYDDMGSRNVDEDTHELLGEEMVNGHKCWKIKSSSKDKRDIYSKKISWIRQDCLIAEKVDYYDRMGKLHRQLVFSKINKIEGFWIAQQLLMTNVQTKHKTLLEIKDPHFNIDLQEHKFTVNSLEKGKL